MPTYKRYPDDFMAEAVQVYKEQGLPAAHKQFGVAKTTILRWARKAGVSQDELNDAHMAKTQAAAELHRAQTEAKYQEARAGLIPKLIFIAHAAADLELETFKAVKNGWPSPLGEELRMRDLVGALTRAVHDMNLLMGDATERVEEPTIIFAAPRPDRRKPPEIIDLGTIPDRPALPPVTG